MSVRRETERGVKARTRVLLGQWRTARFGMGEEEVAEDWARERALLEVEIAEAVATALSALRERVASIKPKAGDWSGRGCWIDGWAVLTLIDEAQPA